MTPIDTTDELFAAPIAEDSPAGSDIRKDTSPSSIYYKIKDARTAARAAERRIIMENDQESLGKMVTDWETVLDVAPNILNAHAKDLEVAAWYIEALLRSDGFAGLNYGFRVAISLIQDFWDYLYPLPDEDGLETRVAPLTGLNGDNAEGTLITPIFQVPLTQGYTDQSYATWHFQQAAEVDRIVDEEKKQARLDTGAISMSQIQRSAIETPYSFYEKVNEDLNCCIESFELLTNLLERKAGLSAPPSSNIKNALRKVKETIGFLTKDMFPDSIPESIESEATNESPSNVSTKPVFTTHGISSREEAVKVLNMVAEYFKKTEPHSPLSYSLEQSIQWSRMSLPELLLSLIPDERAREEYSRLTGVPVRTE